MDVIITSAEPNNVTITCDKPNIIYVVGAQPVNVTISFNIPNQSASQSLKQTLLIGNQTDGENIIINDDDAVQLENGSLLKKGIYDFGANGGISRICGVGFEDMWQSGIRHVFDSNGFIRNSTNCFDIVPDANFDITLRFKIGSIWTLDDGTSYICLDATEGVAVWGAYNAIPTKTSNLTNDGADGVNPFITALEIPFIPTNTSDLTNDSDFVSDENYVHTDNNFTNILKTKLDGIDLSQYLLVSNISNILTGTSTTKALSEAQGKVLKDLVDTKQQTITDVILAQIISSLNAKTILVNNDFFPIYDTAAGATTAKRVSFTSLKSFLKTYFDTLYQTALGFNAENIANKQNSLAADGSGVKYPTVDAVFGALALKVDKVIGKVLSTNDFTNILKTKLDGIADGAEVNVNADWNATTGDAQILNKPTIPSITNLVPYTGATQNLDLGEFELKGGQLTLDTTPTGTAAVATTRWNDSLGSSETTLKGGSVILKNGVDLVARIVNKVTPNTTLTKAAYQVVKVSGAQGQRLAVNLAQANSDNNSADTLGIVTETIPTNQEGFIITVGQIEGINTTGSLQSETWADGDVLYLSPTIAGAITNIKPNGSNGHIVVLGYVEYSHSSQGKIYVKIMNGWELDELHNVYISSVANNQALIYESSTDLWKNKTIDKTFVGLGNVDNTSDANKPVSTAQQTAIDAKVADSITNGVTTIAPSQNAVFDALALKAEAYSNYPFNTTTNYFGLFDIVPTISTSVVIGSTANNTNSAVAFNRFSVDKEITINDFAILQNGANDGASATVTLYIFDDTNAGLPGVKLHQETTATGILTPAQKYITFTNNITLQKGNYWIALHFRGLNTAGTNPSFIGGLVNQPNVVTSIATYGINFRPLITGATADLSNNPTITLGAVQNLPQIFIKI